MHLAFRHGRTFATATSLAFIVSLAICQSLDRAHIRIDDNWRFHKDPKATSRTESGLQWQWKPAPEATMSVDALPGDIASGNWKPAKDHEDLFNGKSGFAWIRSELTWKGPAAAPDLLHFDGIDDNAVVFVNGKRMLGHEGWDDPFDVPLKNVWNPNGPNQVVVLVQNEQGVGGLNGPSTLQTSEEESAAPKQADPAFDDRTWALVHLPHDYVVEGPFDPHADAGHGSLPTMPAWYRKSIDISASDANKSVWIAFDGVYRDSQVYLNGHFLGRHASGYTGFRYDITKFAHFGGKNVIAVRVDPRKQEGWWYEGGGIYRHVWLNVANKVHVKPWGSFVQVKVPTSNGEATGSANLTIETTVENDLATPETVRLTSQIISPSGTIVSTVNSTETIAPTGSSKVLQQVDVLTPKLWSLESPNLYQLRTTVFKADSTIDRVQTSFGIRSTEFNATKGFLLNGKHVEIKGTCNHQDHAGVGIAVPDSLLKWRIAKLKAMGSNAYRCSHNVVASELLDACDRLGMLVMDENRHLGDTFSPKSSKSTPYTDLSELQTMILRDRNHPSIILWSMCNEEGIQGTPEGARIFKAMQDLTKRLDPTRDVSCAMNGDWGKGISLIQDVQGFNYGVGGYDEYRKAFPEMPAYGSETASAVSTRGEYVNDAVKGYVSAYDDNRPSWGNTAEGAWTPIMQRPWIAGGFVWTGFDYKGEPTPYGWPCINSHFGIMDICGFPKDTYYYYKAWWGDAPVVHLLPHWTWPGKEGKPIEVWCHANAQKVELFLNGKSLGSKEVPMYGHLAWTVPYEPGKLVAKGFRDGKLIATDSVETAGSPHHLIVKTDRPVILADGEDVTPVEVSVVDSAGRVVPDSDPLITFSVEGSAHVVGVGNGDPSSHEPDKSNRRKAFHGLCMALIGRSSEKGQQVVTVSAPGLTSATIKINSLPTIFH